jgi:uncharacterized membrane protein YeaQ/YmgE (transglycosylase-associated protein family)
MRTEAQQGILLKIIVGTACAYLRGSRFAPLFSTGTINQNDFSISGLFVSVLDAVGLLAVVNPFGRGPGAGAQQIWMRCSQVVRIRCATRSQRSAASGGLWRCCGGYLCCGCQRIP